IGRFTFRPDERSVCSKAEAHFRNFIVFGNGIPQLYVLNSEEFTILQPETRVSLVPTGSVTFGRRIAIGGSLSMPSVFSQLGINISACSSEHFGTASI